MKVKLLHGVTIDTGELEDLVINAFAAWCEGDPSPGRLLGFIRTKDGLPLLQDIYQPSSGLSRRWWIMGRLRHERTN